MESDTVKSLIRYIEGEKPISIKELSRVVSAYNLWADDDYVHLEILHEHIKNLLLALNSSNVTVRDISRASTALVDSGIIYNKLTSMILSQKTDGSWNEDIYDTTYALKALGDVGIYDELCCKWLIDNFNEKWLHVGTVSLIIIALSKQIELVKKTKIKTDAGIYTNFIEKYSKWVLEQRMMNGGWQHLATSNIAIQALISAGYTNELDDSISWLTHQINECNKPTITVSALTLISLAKYELMLNK